MKSLRKTLISLSLVGAMLAASPLGTVKAAADGKGKYVSEVYVAYGANEQEAAKWLTDNGWEPVSGDLGAGKNSKYDTAVSAVMGIHRTGNASDAITDMAVMNMKGAYNFDMYTEVLKEKKTELNAFLDSFTPALEEYRANLNGEGSEAGRARAELVRDMLNKFYDGEIDGEYALNDTGKPLGDLLASTTKHEFGDEAYEALSKEDKLKYGDLQQILLESTPDAAIIVEQMLALATDKGEESWLERLSAMEGENLVDEIEVLDIGANPGISQSAAEALLAEKYEDVAIRLSQEWEDVHNELVWLDEFRTSQGLDRAENESDEDYNARFENFITDLAVNDHVNYERFRYDITLYSLVYSTEYEGEWGLTLGDFFVPENGSNYSGNYEQFTRFAAALSDGQRAGLEFLSLRSLLMLSADNVEAIESLMPDVSKTLNDAENISIYSGMKRQIFRDGVALTSEALAEKNKGKNPYEEYFEAEDALDVIAYTSFGLGLVTAVVGATLMYGNNLEKLMDKIMPLPESTPSEISLRVKLDGATNYMSQSEILYDLSGDELKEFTAGVNTETVTKLHADVVSGDEKVYIDKSPKFVGGIIMTIGGALMLTGVAVKTWNYLNKYYKHDFTKIPLMIVDEADIVTYRTDADGNQILDENGKPIRDINFDQFAYYDAVKCNRQMMGVNKEAQNGVESYAEWGCGDVADLNCDYGKEWLALYTNKSSAKGNPILADSLTVKYGSNALPENCTKSLHTFRNTYAFNLANDTYSYNDKKNGIYLFWNEDPEAFGTAGAAGSVFGTGLAALFGVGGLGLGILGTMLVMMPRRKKEEV